MKKCECVVVVESWSNIGTWSCGQVSCASVQHIHLACVAERFLSPGSISSNSSKRMLDDRMQMSRDSEGRI